MPARFTVIREIFPSNVRHSRMRNGQYRAHLPRIFYGRGSHFWEELQCRFNLSAGVRVRVGRGNSGLFAEQPGHPSNHVSRRLKQENALGVRPICLSARWTNSRLRCAISSLRPGRSSNHCLADCSRSLRKISIEAPSNPARYSSGSATAWPPILSSRMLFI